MLQDIAQAAVILGVPLIFAAWLAGPSALASNSRRALAPTLREYPAAAYGTAAAVVLLIVAWGPIHATRLVIAILIFFALTMFGVAELRRQTAAEIPDATAGTARADVQTQPDDGSHVADLERLSTLHERGSITDAEFAEQKAVLLTNGGRPRPLI